MKYTGLNRLGSEVVCSDSTNLTAHPTQWGDVTHWNEVQNSDLSFSEMEVVIVAFAAQTLGAVEIYGRAPQGDCYYGQLNNGDDVVLAAATDVAASATDVDATANTFTLATHGLRTGQLCRVTTSNALPAGLAINTDYWVIKVDANTIKVAASYADAIAGTAVDITTTGTGNQTFHLPTAAFRQSLGHSAGSEFYGFKVGDHTGNARVRITVQPVLRYDR